MMRVYLFVTAVALSVFTTFAAGKPIVINHNSCKIDQVPAQYVELAKSMFKITYGHTSHGSQIVSGMQLLANKTGSIYKYNSGAGSLVFNDYTPDGDLGNPDRTTWASRTRDYLNAHTDINVVMWSWCGQVDGSEENINTYLNLMSQLESDYPNVKFVYMTGHLNGSGENGNVNKRNNQIREYCNTNGKILFDFADIESYNPDGDYFLDKDADDGCNYDGGNWATEWCAAHPGECEDCSCAHSEPLNCRQKGYAFWNMMARLAGWDGAVTGIDNPEEEMFSAVYDLTCDCIKIDIMNSLAEESTLQVADLLGNSYYSVGLNSNSEVLKISAQNLASGVYFVTIKSANITKTIKIQKY